ncbi:histidine kinase N-terminal 7TM domain-containing protein [Halobaculum sp. D14]|uniref:histidine kinase N-terminal 7TM domain-containing protein n=1 Tax=Halobaculum sp. D14 TaxID=3421642 RepID=UPI003EB9A4C1
MSSVSLLNPLVLALFLSVAVGAAATILAWRQRPDPGATPLVALLGGQTWWSVCLVFKLQMASTGAKVLWTWLALPGVVVVPVAWLLFALAYTGRDRFIQAENVALLAVVPVVTVALAATNDYHDLLTVSRQVTATGEVVLVEGGPWFWVLAGYTYLLGVLGMIPLFGLLTSAADLFRRQSATLLVAILMPWATNVLFLAGVFPSPGIDPTPIAFSVSGVAYLDAMSRHRLFGTTPAPTTRARQYLFDQTETGAVVVDRNGYVVDANDTFLDIVDRDEQSVLGAPAVDAVPEYDTFPEQGARKTPLSVGDDLGRRSYDVTVAQIHDVRGVLLGRVVTFHDISEHVRQQQRLTVLNRVLRHNLRTETNIIAGHAESFTGEAAETVRERAMRIAELGEKGREAIDLFDEAHGRTEPRSLAALLEDAVADVRDNYSVPVDLELPAGDVRVPAVLAPVFANLVENAAEHVSGVDGRVRVTAGVATDAVRVTVADNGPGIDEYELAVLEAGTETALKHGSGLGLWIVKWGAEIADADVSFRPNDPTGSVVTLDIPLFDGTDGHTENRGRTENGGRGETATSAHAPGRLQGSPDR